MKRVFTLILLSALSLAMSPSYAQTLTNTTLPDAGNSSTPNPPEPEPSLNAGVKITLFTTMLCAAVVVGAVVLYCQNKDKKNDNSFWMQNSLQSGTFDS